MRRGEESRTGIILLGAGGHARIFHYPGLETLGVKDLVFFSEQHESIDIKES